MGELQKSGGKRVCRSFFRRRTADNQYGNRMDANDGGFGELLCIGRGAVFSAGAETTGCSNNFDNDLCFIENHFFARGNCTFCM